MCYVIKDTDKYYRKQEVCLTVMSSCFVVERLEFKSRLNNYEFCNSEQNSQAQFLFRLNDNNNITCLIVFL